MKLSGKLYTTKGEPIAYANVVYIRPDGQSTSNGTMTNDAGSWQLDVPTSGSIRFSHIGHVTRTLPLGSMPFIVTLDPATYDLPVAEVSASKSKLNSKWLIYTGLAGLFLILIKQKK